MKSTINLPYSFRVTLGITLLLLVAACSKEDDTSGTNPDASNINSYIASLSYDANSLLNLQETGGSASERTLLNEYSEASTPVQGTVFDCQIQDFSLESNFDDVAILRPTNDIIYPGALVVGNQDMLDGSPNPIGLDRGPMVLSLDLPGLGEQGTLEIEQPNKSNVKTSLDNALEWWNDNAYEEGYVNAANSTYQSATSYSSTQFGLDIGLNASWATGSIAAQLDYESNTERRYASIVFRQVFYTVSMNTPSSAASVFAPSVSLDQVQNVINSTSPPAYISSVSYGRIIMVRMETTNTDYSVNLNAVLEYASGLNSGSGDINVEYEAILSNSSLNVITIGGNAEVAVSAIDAANLDEGPGSINYIITGENAVYTRNNPGVPIAYTTRYLKDHSLAKLGYTTEYTVEECGSYGFQHDEVTVENDSFHEARFRFKYRGQNSEIIYYSPYYELDQGDILSRTPPSGSHDVSVIFEYDLLFNDWNQLAEYDLNYLYFEKCYEFYGGGIGQASQITSVTCN